MGAPGGSRAMPEAPAAPAFQLQLQLYTAKSQYWLHKAGASPEQWQLKNDNFTYEIFYENIK